MQDRQAKKQLDQLLSAAMEATSESHTTASKHGKTAVDKDSDKCGVDSLASVEFLRATCPGLVPASANLVKRRPTTVPRATISQATKEDSAIFIPTRVR